MSNSTIIPIERIADKIYLIRDEKVMLDFDLAALYQIGTSRLNSQVKRLIRRFPRDFMFRLSQKEFENLKSQIATSSWAGRRTQPYAFTERGILMVASVLHSEQAIDINVAIIRAFVRMRKILATHKDLALKVEKHDKQIANLYAHVERLLTPPKKPKNSIGYIWDKDKKQ